MLLIISRIRQEELVLVKEKSLYSSSTSRSDGRGRSSFPLIFSRFFGSVQELLHLEAAARARLVCSGVEVSIATFQ